MSLTRAIADFKRFSAGDFSREITITNGTTSATVRGLVSNHNMKIDENTGLPINSRNIHCSIAELALTDAGYTVRNASNEINLRNHRVTFKNADGNNATYQIKTAMPSRTLGIIVFTLEEYQ